MAMGAVPFLSGEISAWDRSRTMVWRIGGWQWEQSPFCPARLRRGTDPEPWSGGSADGNGDRPLGWDGNGDSPPGWDVGTGPWGWNMGTGPWGRSMGDRGLGRRPEQGAITRGGDGKAHLTFVNLCEEPSKGSHGRQGLAHCRRTSEAPSPLQDAGVPSGEPLRPSTNGPDAKPRLRA